VNLGTAADERLQGAGAALHISDLDLEASVPEIAKPLGDGERQIEDCRFAADSQPHLRHFRFVLCAGRARQRDCGNRDDGRQGMLHRRFLADSTLDLMPTAMAERISAMTAAVHLSLRHLHHISSPCAPKIFSCRRLPACTAKSAVSISTPHGPWTRP
jgi:hypothetical protein